MIELYYRLIRNNKGEFGWIKTSAKTDEFEKITYIPKTQKMVDFPEEHEVLDMMMCFDEGASGGHIFLGRWNNGEKLKSSKIITKI